MSKSLEKNVAALVWNIGIICAYLFVLGYLQEWWYRMRLWLARHSTVINYDRLKLERRKYEAGFYQDDTRPADPE